MNKFIFIGAADKTDLLLHCAELLSLLADVNVLLVDATVNGNYQSVFGFEKDNIFDYYNKFDITTVNALDGLAFDLYDVCLIDTDMLANLCTVLRSFNEPDEQTKIFCVTSFKKDELLPLKEQLKNMAALGYNNINNYYCVFYDVPFTGIKTDYVLSTLFETKGVSTYELNPTDNDRDLNISEQHNERMNFKKHSKAYRASILNICVNICNLNISWFNKYVKKNVRTLKGPRL